MILNLTEEEKEFLFPILLEKQETEINRPDVDEGKLDLIEGLIEKVESGIGHAEDVWNLGGPATISGSIATGLSGPSSWVHLVYSYSGPGSAVIGSP